MVQRGGAERVVEALAEAFPDAPIYALLFSSDTGPKSLSTRVRSSWLGRIPGASRRHRFLLPLYRYGIEAIDVSRFDIVITSHHTVAKAVLTRSDQLHICYCHTPMRALWERPIEELGTLPAILRPLAFLLFSGLREWDVVTATRVQRFVANSTATQRRISTYYDRTSEIVYPPIDTARFTPGGVVEDYYLVASRPVPYKRVDLAIEATARLGRRLKIVGGRHAMSGSAQHVEFLGHVSDNELVELMRGARALLFPQFEDFGMAPLEMNACGRPVVAYGRGGALDTVIDGVTGVLAPEQTLESFVDAIRRLESVEIDAAVLRAHAMAFSRERFVEQMQNFVREAWTLSGLGSSGG